MQTRKLNELKVANPYLRLGTDVSELEKSITTIGLIAPLVISQDNIILAGGRRYQALLNLGHTEAPVTVVNKGELEKELVSIDENLVRKDLNKMEVEEHLRRAKEIYESIHPEEFKEFKKIEEAPQQEEPSEEHKEKKQSQEDKNQKQVNKEVLPGEKFLKTVSEKTGLSPRQIHQAIDRDEKAGPEVKEARKKGELSIGQTNEIVKLKPEEQKQALDHLKIRPVREIRQFIKLAKTKGLEQAISETPQTPHAREFRDIETSVKKLHKQIKHLEIEGINLEDLPQKTKSLLKDIYNQLPTHIWQQNQFKKEDTHDENVIQ